jgi:hypothetical protein
MTDTFHSCEITPNGISVKVGTHRRALGVKDYATKAAFKTAVALMLEDVLGKDLASVAATVAAAETDASAKVAAAQAEKDAAIAEADAAIEILGTKDEAAGMMKAKRIAQAEADIAAKTAELAELKK